MGPKPSQRRLRVFAFDPGIRAQLDTLSISELTLKLTWEDDLKPGPVGEYLEVVDYDPASHCFYAPVDLNHPYLLAQDGLAPAEGGPQMHQQMVYAVAMNTIDHFERALGRVALWNHRVIRNSEGQAIKNVYVQRLRIYPHALREPNAYYSPLKKALLFGYFPTHGTSPGQVPGGMVFTSLSYDVVAHETTHALLDGLHPSFNEATNPDVHALHEGFADIVALLQRFAHPEILEHQISRTRGSLDRQNMLGELAQQFGQALGMRGALRSALGELNDGVWQMRKPDPTLLHKTHSPHERGGILLAAVFAAFLAIYRSRSADLFRIATGGTGVLRDGEIHPDLVRRLAREASSAAEAVLTMCIRGLDYCPPVDVDFGTYLRAVVTADFEAYPDDEHHYRLAFIEAFRQWGIFPEGVRSMAESDLRYPKIDDDSKAGAYDQEATKGIFKGIPGRGRNNLEGIKLDWDLSTDRKQVWETKELNARILHGWLKQDSMRGQLAAFGLSLDPKPPLSVFRSKNGSPTLEVHSVRLARRRGFRDTLITDLVVEVRQRRRGYLDPQVQTAVDAGAPMPEKEDFRFRRGCTLILDPLNQKVRYVIKTRGDINNDTELDRVRQFLTREHEEVENPFYGPRHGNLAEEHFAALHRRHSAKADF